MLLETYDPLVEMRKTYIGLTLERRDLAILLRRPTHPVCQLRVRNRAHGFLQRISFSCKAILPDNMNQEARTQDIVARAQRLYIKY